MQKIGKLQEEVATSQDDVVQKIVKKLKADRGYTFWKKGHEQQFWFNADIDNVSRKLTPRLIRCNQHQWQRRKHSKI